MFSVRQYWFRSATKASRLPAVSMLLFHTVSRAASSSSVMVMPFSDAVRKVRRKKISRFRV